MIYLYSSEELGYGLVFIWLKFNSLALVWEEGVVLEPGDRVSCRAPSGAAADFGVRCEWANRISIFCRRYSG